MFSQFHNNNYKVLTTIMLTAILTSMMICWNELACEMGVISEMALNKGGFLSN